MATKLVKTFPSSGPHTAGIFADMSVDGPEIGTLVVVIDKAKNLPNRKTIGKQDPYCAARLGKEAKKTSTDIRGGQTPKWDQELRFTVHDCADYYQLKVSVFTDDKRTDLVGEAWVDLKAIVIPGGGQNDLWQTLSCRGKYAGEIRVEITYYDTRPSAEKPAAPRTRQSASPEKELRTPMKRRPLPSDPVTGEAPPAPPVAAPSPAASQQDVYPTTPRSHGKHPGYVPNQSPLQAVEYSTPPSTSRHAQPEYFTPPSHSAPHQAYASPTRQDHYSPQSRQPQSYASPSRPSLDERADYSPRGMETSPSPDPRAQYTADTYELPPSEDPRNAPPMDIGRPPPPPAHRSRHNSGASDAVPRHLNDASPTKPVPMPMRHDVLKSEAHRHSMPSYPGQPMFRSYGSSPVSAETQHQPSYEPTAQRHHSYDSVYDPHPRSLQPTVEDVPDSPTGYANHYQQSEPRGHYEDEMEYDGHAHGMRGYSRSPGESPYGRSPTARSPLAHPGTPSSYASRGQSTSPGYIPPHVQAHQRAESEPPPQMHHHSSYPGPAGLPASLVPGVDPNLSREISDYIHEERRQDPRYQPNTSTPPRGRHRMDSYPYGQGPSNPGNPQHQYGTSPHERRPGPGGYGSGPEHRMPSHSVSPGPNHPTQPNQTIRRKSVSPAPPTPEQRRLSDVPFGPDSYNAFNTSMSPSPDGRTPEERDPDAKIITHDGREIDPSDHLPMDTWAPEPEPKEKKPSPDPRARPSPSGAQPMPPSGRRPLRVARPQTMPAPPPAPSYGRHDEPPHTPPGPSSAGRNRLQKKAHRSSTAYSPAGSSPLAPLTPDNYQDRQSPYTPTRGPVRSSTWDYPSENHAPQHHHQGYAGPPIPGKVPLPVMSGANGPVHDQMTILEEMQRIDIGAGRSRRRGGH